jgi:hypothetical protein
MKQFLNDENQSQIAKLIKITTQNLSEQIQIMGKYISLFSMTKSWDVLPIFNLFEELPVSVLNGIFDLLQIAQIRQLE